MTHSENQPQEAQRKIGKIRNLVADLFVYFPMEEKGAHNFGSTIDF
jgi:hypothetical protein